MALDIDRQKNKCCKLLCDLPTGGAPQSPLIIPSGDIISHYHEVVVVLVGVFVSPQSATPSFFVGGGGAFDGDGFRRRGHRAGAGAAQAEQPDGRRVS